MKLLQLKTALSVPKLTKHDRLFQVNHSVEEPFRTRYGAQEERDLFPSSGSHATVRRLQESRPNAVAPLFGEGSTLQIRCAVFSFTVTP